MKPKSTIGLIIIILCFLQINSELLHSSTLIRHGARSDVSKKLYDENKEYFLDSEVAGLTPNGYTMEQLVGSYLHQRYIKGSIEPSYKGFLKSPYDDKETTIKVSLTERTIYSAVGFIHGLYPDNFFRLSDTILNINNDFLPPIKFYSNIKLNQQPNLLVLDGKNNSFFAARKCYGDPTIPEFELTQKEKELIDELESFFPKEIKKIKKNNYAFEEIKHLFDLLKSLNNISTKFSFKNYNPDLLILINKVALLKSYQYVTTDTQKKLYASALLADIKKNIKYCNEEVKSEKCKKLNLYSLHDTNIIDVFNNILSQEFIDNIVENGGKDQELTNILIPQFAASLIFELHKEENDHFVKIFLNGEESLTEFILGIKYQKNKGILLSDFNKILESRIDYSFKTLACLPKKPKK